MPFEQRSFRISCNSIGLIPGDTIINSSEVTYDDFGVPTTVYSSLTQEISCAYDPNDKMVSPEGFDVPHYTLKTDTLLYTIRFQNTGNDTAFVVKIRDTLSTHLDYSTFRFIGSSHPVNILRQPNGAMLLLSIIFCFLIAIPITQQVVDLFLIQLNQKQTLFQVLLLITPHIFSSIIIPQLLRTQRSIQ